MSIISSESKRFWSHVAQINDADSCWVIDLAVMRKTGYSNFKIGSKRNGTRKDVLAHRFAYEDVIGPIPEGMTLDHDCHTRDTSCLGGPTCPHRRCVRPSHLRPMTRGANTVAGGNAVKTRCKRDHDFTPANTILRADGRRNCRTCENAAQRKEKV